ncbi:MAG: SDR family oxidoreductase, partial [Dehalococcoidia bacterium]|nr:SDR family oxidoreductase [Dehalococcoidia bacterium]
RKLASVVADISQRAEINRMLGVALEAFGRVDILINNAGIFTRQPILEMTDEAWDGVIAVNLKGAFLCSQVIGKQMVAQRQGGKILNMSSRAGLMAANDDLIAYATTKAGLIHMTRVFARALAPHKIRVNALAPVHTDTGKQSTTSKTTVANIPLGRFGLIDDVALAALFLVSDMSDFITGITIPIDGGAVYAV